jgi:hypothetical protein
VRFCFCYAGRNSGRIRRVKYWQTALAILAALCASVAQADSQPPSFEAVSVFGKHLSDIRALDNRSMSKNDTEWCNRTFLVARSAEDYAIGVDTLSKLHWQPEDKPVIKAYLDYIREMLTNDVNMLDRAVNNAEVAVIREEAKSLRNDIRAFETLVDSMMAAVAARPSPTPSRRSTPKG